MRYGMFQLDSDESPVVVRARAHTTATTSAFVKRSRVRRRHAPSNPRGAGSDLCFARDVIGTPFRILPVMPPRQAISSPYAKVDWYRELVTKANLALDPLSSDKLSTARSSAANSFVMPIQREMEEVQRFLDNLTISTPQAPSPGPRAATSAEDLDTEITAALKQVSDMRDEHEKKLLQMKQEKEERARQIEERKAQEKKAKEEAERKKKDDEQAKLNAAASKRATVLPTTTPAPVKHTGSSISNSSTAAAKEWASKYRTMYTYLMNDIAPSVKNNKAMKDYCFKQRGVIVRSFGQLKDSQEFVSRISDTVIQIIAGSPAGVEQWILNLVAKAIVKQAEKEVSVAHHAAFPLAAAAVLVMQRFPLLADMLLVRLVKKCPYIIPEYAVRKQGQSAEEYLRSIGYKEKEEDELETDIIYVERMAGIVALFSAIVQTTDASGVANAQKRPLPISFGWTWLARMVNLRPRAISPLLVHTFLSIAGPSMAAAYGRQFGKLLDVLAGEWINEIKDSKDPVAVAATSNLCGFIDDYRKTGKFKECAGRVIRRR
ncbi:Nuclear pore complex nucleoporin component [Coemansia sp. IMI 209127]|nr:Nuclear pore complex nucleoporin component [Coemansia sp. IMI 209127]